MTKDEIIAPKFISLEADVKEAIKECMDEYAKQMATAFAIDYNKGVDDRMEVRYNHFVEHQKQNNP